ncbi:protein TIC 62, chloroplastic isoform X1 [Sesamum indicum]|uniref:Protein TIC 62, chloroplastic isoform X1 n=1 Tax=Sesamum indicum TaxID=4182 RepID=A0A6I9TRJ0_SESIN|nr:protein TIC 62, chloroplastic isoform X1 [Sesamum indicum]
MDRIIAPHIQEAYKNVSKIIVGILSTELPTMELRCIQSPTVSSIPRSGLLEKPLLCGQTSFKLPGSRRTCPDDRRLKCRDLRARRSGTTKIKSQAQDPTSSDGDQKDENLVYVAGATGRVGSRTVRELLKLGFRVRAAVRSIQRAESLVQSVQNMKLDDVAGGTQPTDKFELVECDLEKPDQIGPALGNSSIVICCIGASEKEIFDVTGPYRIDYLATKNLIDAATSAKVDHFILLTSLGTNKFGFPAAILNLFWGVLCWKRKAEEALLASGLPYTIVRPGGMERPTDSYKETHNITLSEEDTLFGGQVSNLQVAELVAFMARNRSLSYCKVVEVIAETTSPLTPLGDLIKKIPSQREEVYPQKESDEADELQPVVPDSTYTEKEPEQIKATTARSSSPYTMYEDVKPPTSPTPTPSTGSGSTQASKIEITPIASSSISTSVEVNSLETSSTSINDVLPEIAPRKTNFSSPYPNYEDLKPPTSPTPTPSTGSGSTQASKIEITPTASSSIPSSVEVNSLEASSASVNYVLPEIAPKKTNFSSPYPNYEDLKPPTSPTPTPSTGSGSTKASYTDTMVAAASPTSSSLEVNSSQELSIAIENVTPLTIPKRASPSSPYPNYEDLKPPSSPTPTPSRSKEVPSISLASTEAASQLTGGNDVAKSESTEVGNGPAKPSASDHSPYLAYDDLKPPSPLSPSVPTVPGNAAEEKLEDMKYHTESKTRPLSPYTMYEELKPPSSPTPSPPRKL